MNLSDITSWLTADETRINLPSSYHGDFLCPSNESNFPEWSEGLGCCRGVWLWAASRRPCVIRQTRYKQTWGWGDAEMLIHSVTCSTAYLHVIIQTNMGMGRCRDVNPQCHLQHSIFTRDYISSLLAGKKNTFWNPSDKERDKMLK